MNQVRLYCAKPRYNLFVERKKKAFRGIPALVGLFLQVVYCVSTEIVVLAVGLILDFNLRAALSVFFH